MNSQSTITNLLQKLETERLGATAPAQAEHAALLSDTIKSIKQLRTALTDAVNRPMGVIPTSAEGLLGQADYARATPS